MELLSLFLSILALAFLVLYTVVCTVALVGTLTIFTRYSKSQRNAEPPLSPSQFLWGVSILRPLKGLDPQLEECLESTFLQNYPQFEIILSVADESDPAAQVARTLIARYPDVPARLIIGTNPRVSVEANILGAEDIGPNPKINNLVRSYASAKYDTLWIVDANTYVPPNALRHSVEIFLESSYHPRPIQLIHHLPLCVVSDPDESVGWGALLEELYLSTSHAKFYVSINRFGIAPCVMGKSNLFHKSVLDRATNSQGLAKFANYIAEDHLIADTLWYQTPNPGANHAMTRDIARQPVQLESLATYIERRIRWIRVRKYMVTSATLIEPFTECFLAGIIGSFALYTLFGVVPRRWFVAHVLWWLVLDFAQFYTLHCNSDVDFSPREKTPEFARGSRSWNPKRLGRWFVCWFIREITCFPIWLVAMCGESVIKWRNRKFMVRRDMTVIEIR
jgi:ceramide glucosyltransferase